MSEIAKPRTIIVTTEVEWRAVLGPALCDCGHEHYGRLPLGTGLAPQWNYCEDPTCECRALRRGTREFS